MRLLGIVILMAGLGAVSAAAAAPPPAVTANKAWMRYLLPNIPAGGYMALHNAGTADVVMTGAASSACNMLMLHKSDDASGMAMMMDIQTITVPAGGTVDFTPGGYHLMCMQPKMHVGDDVPVTLMFERGYTLAVTMHVYGAAGAP